MYAPHSPKGYLCHAHLQPRKRRFGDLSEITHECQSWDLNPCCLVSASVCLTPHVDPPIRLGSGSQPAGIWF